MRRRSPILVRWTVSRRRELAMAAQLVGVIALAMTGVACAQCSVWVAAIPVGDYDPSSDAAVVLGSDIDVRCDQDSVQISLSIGPSATSGSVVDRRMRHGHRAEFLRYNLYQDQNATRLWGDTDSTALLRTTERGRVIVQVFARIDPRQDVWVGDYHDEVVLTVLP
jgi:spore coat protein U-like protein